MWKTISEFVPAVGKAWWAVTVNFLIGGVIGLYQFVRPNSAIPAWLAPVVCGIGFLLALICAFHNLRVERDRALVASSDKGKTNRIEKIKGISATLKELSYLSNLSNGPGMIDAATRAGHLMIEAMDYGLWDDVEHSLVRATIRTSLSGGFTYQRSQSSSEDIIPAPEWHVFTNTVMELRRKAGKTHMSFSDVFVSEGCDLISGAIDATVGRISSD